MAVFTQFFNMKVCLNVSIFQSLKGKETERGGVKAGPFFHFFFWIFLASKWPHLKKGPMGHHKLVFLESSPIMVMKPKSKKNKQYVIAI